MTKLTRLEVIRESLAQFQRLFDRLIAVQDKDRERAAEECADQCQYIAGLVRQVGDVKRFP